MRRERERDTVCRKSDCNECMTFCIVCVCIGLVSTVHATILSLLFDTNEDNMKLFH